MKFVLSAVNDEYNGFTLQNIKEIEELQCTFLELEHTKSGARIIHIANEDAENLFCLCFQTLPDTSNGVAHILEHTVLCGSKKYPVKDPFFAMTRRSLNTFMNAFTGADFTCYPAASQLPKDFYNLLDVYLDAVFSPILSKESFLQEGHRLEFEKESTGNLILIRKGIVFNEMKGALASSSARLNEALNSALYPDLTYGINSGGDPKEIPNLTHAQLLEFHKKFYHPSRCSFFFYGNIPLKNHLDFLHEKLLKDVVKEPKLAPLPPQKRYNQPLFQKKFYPAIAEENHEEKTFVAIGWLTCHIKQEIELLALSVLITAIADTDASPIKVALLKSGLCKQVSCYMDTEVSEIPIVFHLKGCKEGSSKQIETILLAELQKLHAEGIPKPLIYNALHQIELSRCEISGGGYPFGLSLFFRSILSKQHGAKAEDGLRIHTLFSHLHQITEKNSRYFEELIDRFFIKNNHRVTLEMVPDPLLEFQENEQEAALLKKIEESLSEKEKQEIIQQTQKLQEYQKKQEEADIDVLPKVSLEDIVENAINFELEELTHDTTKIYSHQCFTNGMTYVDLVFDLPEIKEKDLSLFRLLTLLIPQLGCNGLDYIQTMQKMQSCSAGISCSASLHSNAKDCNLLRPTLFFHSHCLHRTCHEMLPLLKAFTTSVDFSDKNRIKEVLLKHFTQLDSSLSQGGMRYAVNLACSPLGSSGRLHSAWYGIEYFSFIRKIVLSIDDLLPQLIIELENLYNLILLQKPFDIVISSDAQQFNLLKEKKFYSICSKEASQKKLWQPNFIPQNIGSQGRLISSQVAFIAKACQTVPYTHEDAPALLLASSLIENGILHPKIREQGGAYGAGASCNVSSGNFYLYTYRDPHIKQSFETFNEAVLNIAEGDFDDADLEEAKFEAIQDMDAPVAPGNRAEVAYNWLLQGKTYQIRQQFRKLLLAADRRAIQRAVKTYLLNQLEYAPLVVFAGKELLEKENKEMPFSLSIEAI